LTYRQFTTILRHFSDFPLTERIDFNAVRDMLDARDKYTIALAQEGYDLENIGRLSYEKFGIPQRGWKGGSTAMERAYRHFLHFAEIVKYDAIKELLSRP
jgi:hypothetical protein